MPSGSIEAVKESLQRWLRSSRFVDAIAAVDAQAVAEGRDDNTRATPVPDADAIFTTEKHSLAKYPAVELVNVRVAYAPDTEAKIRAIELGVVFSQAGDDEALVTRDVERLIEAAGQLLRGSFLDTRDGIKRIELASEDYSELTPGQGGTFLRGGELRLAIATIT